MDTTQTCMYGPCSLFKESVNSKHAEYCQTSFKATGLTLTGRCLLDILLEVVLEPLLRGGPLRLAAASVDAGGDASPAAVLPLLDL